jgi:hypothetical protein
VGRYSILSSDEVSLDDGLLTTSGYPAGFLKLSTPFSKDIVVDFKQNKVDAILVTSGFVKYSSGKEISIENRFRFDEYFVPLGQVYFTSDLNPVLVVK